MAREKICGIYCIENMVNGKKYIGQSVDIYTRWRRHKSDLNNGRHCGIHMQRSWDQYGEDNFRFYIIEICDRNDLDMKEQDYIQKYKTYEESLGYNLTNGGGTYILTENKIKENIRYKNELWGIPIYQINFSGEIIKRWESARVASRELKYNQSCVWNCLNGKRKTYNKYIWVYESEFKNFDINNYINPKAFLRKVICIDLDGNIVKEYECANYTKQDGFDPSRVLKICKGESSRYQTHHGFVFRFAQ